MGSQHPFAASAPRAFADTMVPAPPSRRQHAAALIEAEPYRFGRRIVHRLDDALERTLGGGRALRRAGRLQHEQQQRSTRHCRRHGRSHAAPVPRRSGSLVSIRRTQRLPPTASGKVKGTISVWEFMTISSVESEPTRRMPVSCARPSSSTPRHRALPSFQFVVRHLRAGRRQPAHVLDAQFLVEGACQEAAPPQHRQGVADHDQLAHELGQVALRPARYPASRPRRSRCPGSSCCCCPSGCARTRRHPAASAYRAPGSASPACCASGAVAWRGFRHRRSGPRRRSCSRDCANDRPGCSRRWPRCACRCTRPGQLG